MKRKFKAWIACAALAAPLSIVLAYNAQAIYEDIAQSVYYWCGSDTTCQYWMWHDAVGEWEPAADAAEYEYVSFVSSGMCYYDPELCTALQSDALELMTLIGMLKGSRDSV